MADPLFSVRNSFYLGAYQTTISEASHLTGLSEAEKIERDVFVYRAYIELGSYDLVQSEINSSSAEALQAVKQLANYMKDPSSGPACLEQIAAWMEDGSYASNPTVCLIAGMIYALEENYVEALRACHGGATLELMALSTQILLKMNRLDQAEKQIKAMSNIDDDATLSQLASAWTNMQLGGAKVQEAYYTFQELGDKFVWTVRLHNGLATCQMRMGRWEDAEAELLQAFEKNPKDADTLANLSVCSLHMGKPSSRYTSLLKGVNPGHPLLVRAEAGEEAFDRAAASVSS